MELRAERIDVAGPQRTVLLHASDADQLTVGPLDRVELTAEGETEVAIVAVTESLVEPGRAGVTEALRGFEGVVDVTLAPNPSSAGSVRRKLADEELTATEIDRFVRDVHENRLSDVELSAYVSGVFANGLSVQETQNLTESMAGVGRTLDWGDAVVADKHSVGGVVGNRVTPIVVPIVAAAGVTIPKTSSRAVTSPAGTADTMEVFCPVALGAAELRAVVEETNGSLAWGGGVNLSPVDDKLIRVERPLSLDPPGQVVASVLSKKKAAGATHVLVDIPYGEGSKVGDLPEARDVAQAFKRVGEHLDLRLECSITRGAQPIGRGVGPVLEARDVLAVLGGDGPPELRTKSLQLANVLFDLCGVDADAAGILDDGRALAKFREIVAAQGGDPDVERDDLAPAAERETLHADRDGVVAHADNALLSGVARRAGAPAEKAAGLYVHRRVGAAVSAHDPLFTVYAPTEARLDEAVAFARDNGPIRVQREEDALVELV